MLEVRIARNRRRSVTVRSHQSALRAEERGGGKRVTCLASRRHHRRRIEASSRFNTSSEETTMILEGRRRPLKHAGCLLKVVNKVSRTTSVVDGNGMGNGGVKAGLDCCNILEGLDEAWGKI